MWSCTLTGGGRSVVLHPLVPGSALYSNLMGMIFAQDDLCWHAVITRRLYDFSYWKSMSHKMPHHSALLAPPAFHHSPITLKMAPVCFPITLVMVKPATVRAAVV